jgi:integrase
VNIIWHSAIPTQDAALALTAVSSTIRWDATVHGFRATLKTWAAERTNFAREVVEAALAHVEGDKVEAAYQRGDLFDKRRRLMAAWAEFITKVPVKDNVVAIARA